MISLRSFATVNYTHYALPTSGTPDFTADVTPSTAVGTRLDVSNLDQLGRLTVLAPVAGQTAYNAFIQPLIDRYGYTLNGVKTGGGIVGYGSEFNNQDFFRDALQLGYNLTLGTTLTHDLHLGYEWYKEREGCRAARTAGA